MRILFICLSTLKFNTRTPYHEPLGGTESAIAYLAPELANLGHDVTLMSNNVGGVFDKVLHVPISEDVAQHDPDIVVLVSAPQAAPAIKKLVPKAKIILWCHMMPDQPAMLHLIKGDAAKDIFGIVYVSERQREAFKSLDVDNASTVIGNAISPCFENMFTSVQTILETKKCRGVYTSTPFRGLAILANLQELPIDVYSSMMVYQGDDAPFASMYANLKANDCLNLKGSVSQQELVEALKSIAFLVYPCIFTECDSIAILEAMAAGLKVITTDMASPQTEYVDSLASTNGSVDAYATLLRKNINSFRAHPGEWAEKMFDQIRYINHGFTWKKKASEWDKHLRTLVERPEKA